ncbi:MAG: hypothetical protein HSCHL_1147 [Hydrogenibacillus schlegelii]|uniref:Prenylated flavin chaperone LpdD-like domain-containing protein n=1 Tax=Hydrogenibacillus schlegelii TaxID=1484 RepID=A0A2T5G6K5_HYDSH|nr:hypothetical protein [Hydrogenibacillus schlegelii]PTQ51810.1 MAG: hypothetical protein HSCHL_1147 [Hydrogenibacillus schlegelii]
MTGFPFDVRLRTVPMGKDIAFLITGGQAHIGAVATAYPVGDRVRVAVHALPGHREGDLAAGVARMATEALGCTVVVAMGIHVEGVTKEEINTIVRTVRRLMEDELARIARWTARRTRA